jgi:diadenylate cyclase
VLVNLLEIIIITMIFNYLLSFFWNTRAMDLVFGLFAFLLSFIIVKEFHLPVLEKIMVQLANVAMIGIFILFQPELRLALSKLSFKSRKYREMTEFDKFLSNVGSSVYRLAEKKVGALIVLENQDSLEEYANKAVKISARFSGEVLESIFMTTTPLHDGAVIIRETTILSAATILPLADDSSQLVKSMGTRHRAGLGISQLTDALVIVVSEENGKVSIARDGIMTRGVKIDRFKGIIRSIFQSPKAKKVNLFGWFKE